MTDKEKQERIKTLEERDLKHYRNFINQRNKTSDTYLIMPTIQYTRHDAVQHKYKGDSEEPECTVLEFKWRDKAYIDTFDDCLIDLDKICYLQKVQQDYDTPVYVIVFYPKSNKVLMWRIQSDISYKWIWKKCNKCTVESTEEKVNKKMVPLYIKDALQYTYDFKLY